MLLDRVVESDLPEALLRDIARCEHGSADASADRWVLGSNESQPPVSRAAAWPWRRRGGGSGRGGTAAPCRRPARRLPRRRSQCTARRSPASKPRCVAQPSGVRPAGSGSPEGSFSVTDHASGCLELRPASAMYRAWFRHGEVTASILARAALLRVLSCHTTHRRGAGGARAGR